VRRRAACAAAAALAAILAAGPALARVGGGGGYSHGGGGGGDGDAGLVFGLVRLLIWLVFRQPVIGIPVLIVVVIVVSRMARSGELKLRVGERPVVYPLRTPATGPANLTPVRATDPYFSEPVFVDFAQLVFARAHEMRGAGRREPLAPWMSEAAIDRLFSDRAGLESVSEVIFGATRIASASTQAGFVHVDVDFEANVTEVRAGVRAQVLCEERWTFRRKAGARSPAPERMRALGCAGCGSTEEPAPDGTCASCGTPRRGGLSQWEVAAIAQAARRPLDPPELETTDGGVERGTDAPTMLDPRLSSERRAFEGRHPDHSWGAFEAEVRETFVALQAAWSTGDWERARGRETDALHQAHRFWMKRYAEAGWVNHVERVEVGRIVPVKLGVDACYEAITVRIFARALDWTEDREGRVIAGSKTEPRAFSEYWTFLRAIPGAVPEPTSCPSCGAPLPAGGAAAAAVCAYCGSKLSGGSSRWVASRIEQDDAFRA